MKYISYRNTFVVNCIFFRGLDVLQNWCDFEWGLILDYAGEVFFFGGGAGEA